MNSRRIARIAATLKTMFSRTFVMAVIASALMIVSCSKAFRDKAADNENGPLFRVDARPDQRLTIIDYGDMRFTDPAETRATNPRVRRWLVAKIASERPVAVFLSGDVPWHGGIANDYAVFNAESKLWRDNEISIIPALGNHEFSRGLQQSCLENWWTAFPKLRGRRYYSVQIGDDIYGLNLDTELSLMPGSRQAKWIQNQLARLPSTIKWALINLHHPPVADFQVNGDASHNPRPNEIALSRYLQGMAARLPVRFIVIAGHIHNYERFFQDNIVYLVSGGGGAHPRPIVRSSEDYSKTTLSPIIITSSL